ncbi:QWRF motif-containing protein 7 [Prunus yedoensis var. nudiflora]|uniref:QWRF motif-containing protein 7 n=1 Tax=Prunus yedoensis var. nudiflora TaxID=2094558 RepID=A0A314YAK4_PRUYE|nr:QWRF motif-containing protein 7 [Prunus yedoensis var. nudiflora]
MENPFTRRQQQQSSPRLLRSRSGTIIPTIALPPNNSQRFTTPRSKSTTKSRTTSKNHEEDKVLVLTQNKGQENAIRQQGTNLNVTTSSFGKLLPRGSTSPSPRPRISSVPPPRSPSAWALSPGRYLPCKVAPESPAVSTKAARVKSSSSGAGGSGSSGVSGVLKYFRLQKKVSPIQEEDFHRFRLLHNRLLQWRFANARAEASLLVAKRVSQDKIFSVWLRTLKVRNYFLEKRMQMQRLKHEIKVYQILNPQIFLLNEWGKLDRKNQESVSRLVRKLSGISNTLPLVHDSKADVASVYEAMTKAVLVMEGIEAMVTKLLPQLEKVLYMVTELLIAQKQQKDLEENITTVAALVEEEASVRAHLIQLESQGAEANITSIYKIQINNTNINVVNVYDI